MAGFVQLADSAQSEDLDGILAFATQRLADYKVPETFKIVDKIPRNTLGKIDRQLLLTRGSVSRRAKGRFAGKASSDKTGK